MRNWRSFRPLTGFMVLNHIAGKLVAVLNLVKVSVPLRGLWFLIFLIVGVCIRRVSFRPLTGFMVLNQ